MPGDSHLAFLSDRTGSPQVISLSNDVLVNRLPQIWTVRVLDGSLTLISNFTAPVAQLKFCAAHCAFLFGTRPRCNHRRRLCVPRAVADTETGDSVKAAASTVEALVR